MSGYTEAGFRTAFPWADAIMVEYNREDPSAEPVMAEAAEKDIAVMVKKGLASGKLAAGSAVSFVLSNLSVTSLVIGGLNLDHIHENLALAGRLRGSAMPAS